MSDSERTAKNTSIWVLPKSNNLDFYAFYKVFLYENSIFSCLKSENVRVSQCICVLRYSTLVRKALSALISNFTNDSHPEKSKKKMIFLNEFVHNGTPLRAQRHTPTEGGVPVCANAPE
jgi:hypothetical protein